MNIKKMVYSALFVAFMAVASQISIPIQPVPINMAVFAVLLAGLVMGKRYGTLATLVYVLLGAVGVPVFSSFRGGMGVIAGPTGGYILGYIIIALICGCVVERTDKKTVLCLFMALAVAICYAMGTAWYCFQTGNGVVPALSLCVLPFIPGDLLKIVLALVVYKRAAGVIKI